MKEEVITLTDCNDAHITKDPLQLLLKAPQQYSGDTDAGNEVLQASERVIRL